MQLKSQVTNTKLFYDDTRCTKRASCICSSSREINRVITPSTITSVHLVGTSLRRRSKSVIQPYVNITKSVFPHSEPPCPNTPRTPTASHKPRTATRHIPQLPASTPSKSAHALGQIPLQHDRLATEPRARKRPLRLASSRLISSPTRHSQPRTYLAARQSSSVQSAVHRSRTPDDAVRRRTRAVHRSCGPGDEMR